MSDEPPPISERAKNKLYKKAAVPFVVIFFIFMGYLVYLMKNNLYKSTFDLLVIWSIPFVPTGILTWNTSVETLYYLKVRKSLRFHLRRFCMNTLLSFMIYLPFLGILVFHYAPLSPYMDKLSTLLASTVCFVLFTAILFRWQHIKRKCGWKEP